MTSVRKSLAPARPVVRVVLVVLVLLLPAVALAQAPAPVVAAPAATAASPASPSTPTQAAPRPADTRLWDIEFHRGFGFGDPARGGSGSVPSPGEPFTTGGGSPSRRVTSWHFGDGASLLNDVLDSFGRPERVVPLDAVLTQGATDQTVADGFGGRVTRRLTAAMALEVAFEYGSSTLVVTQEARDAIRATSESFPIVFAGLVASGQGVAFTNPSLTSSFSVIDGSGSESMVTGALVFSSPAPRRFRPYVTIGGGLARAIGEASATLTGRYAFTLPSGARVSESDTVTARFAGGNGLVVLAGTGLSVYLSKGSGVRGDARYLLVQNHIHTYVETAPTVDSSLPADAIWSSLTPGIQFGTQPSLAHTSNLTAPALSEFRTMKGGGFNNRFSASVGYFIRF